MSLLGKKFGCETVKDIFTVAGVSSQKTPAGLNQLACINKKLNICGISIFCSNALAWNTANVRLVDCTTNKQLILPLWLFKEPLNLQNGFYPFDLTLSTQGITIDMLSGFPANTEISIAFKYEY